MVRQLSLREALVTCWMIDILAMETGGCSLWGEEDWMLRGLWKEMAEGEVASCVVGLKWAGSAES